MVRGGIYYGPMGVSKGKRKRKKVMTCISRMTFSLQEQNFPYIGTVVASNYTIFVKEAEAIFNQSTNFALK